MQTKETQIKRAHNAEKILNGLFREGVKFEEDDVYVRLNAGEFDTLTTVIHQFNVQAGWWNDPTTGNFLGKERDLDDVVCLIHSEISEALEGYRKNLQDDKLPHHPMLIVELADTAIRCFDAIGGYAEDYRWTNKTPRRPEIDFAVAVRDKRITRCLNMLHGYTNATLFFKMRHDYTALRRTVVGCYYLAENMGYNLTDIILEKVVFNAERADHKLEERKKAGGKRI